MLLQSKLRWSMGCRHLGTAQISIYSLDFACLFTSLVLPMFILHMTFTKIEADFFFCNIQTLTLQRIEPYSIARVTRSNGHPESKSGSSGNLSPQTANSVKTSLGRLSVSQNSDPALKEAKPVACRASDFHSIWGFVPYVF